MTSTISVLGLYQYDNTLFDLMNYPEDFLPNDKQILINNLLAECAEFEVLYPSPSFMKTMIAQWSAKEYPTWNRLYKLALMESNPIENYNRTEETTETADNTRKHSGSDSYSQTIDNDVTNSGTDSNAHTGTITTAHTGTDSNTHKVAGFDSGTAVLHDSDDMQHGHTETVTHNNTDALTHGAKVATDETTSGYFTHGEQVKDDNELTRESHISGNIGVTTSQQMAEQEIELAPKLNITNYIIDSFKNRFCLLVY